MFKLFISNKIKIGTEVTVETSDGVILSTKTKVTNISPCGEYIQTELGLAYIPKKQIKKL